MWAATVALLVFAAGVAYFSRCGIRIALTAQSLERTQRHAMPANRNEPLEAFRGAYGQLCVLMAQATKQGQSRDLVVEAARGKGSQQGPIFVKLRSARANVNDAIDGCRASMCEIVNAGREIKAVVESEWMTSIPMFSEVSHG